MPLPLPFYLIVHGLADTFKPGRPGEGGEGGVWSASYRQSNMTSLKSFAPHYLKLLQLDIIYSFNNTRKRLPSFALHYFNIKTNYT